MNADDKQQPHDLQGPSARSPRSNNPEETIASSDLPGSTEHDDGLDVTSEQAQDALDPDATFAASITARNPGVPTKRSDDSISMLSMTRAGSDTGNADSDFEVSEPENETQEVLTASFEGEQRLIGRYEIRHQLGEGAFGQVFKALDPQLDRVVAVKVAKPFVDKKQAKRFTREARAAAQLRHPGIIPVYEYGEVDGHHIIVYEFVPGETLRSYVKRMDPLTLDRKLEIVKEIAEGLDYAHEQGIVHRDMKPDNVMIDLKGKIHIADFGCARAENDVADLTVDGSILGTPTYMSPEQASGQSRTADGRSDIWSLGVMFYELLAGERPFSGSLQEILTAICNHDPKSLRKVAPEVPIDLVTICNKCLSRDLDKRFVRGNDLADELTRFQDGEPILSRRIGPVKRAWMWAKRNQSVALLGSAVVLVLLLSTIFVSAYALRLKTERDGHAQTQVNLLLESEARSLPGIFSSLAEYEADDPGSITNRLEQLRSTDELSEQLQKVVNAKSLNAMHELRILLALLELEKDAAARNKAAKGMLNRLIETDSDHFKVCRDCLQFHGMALKDALWSIAKNEKKNDDQGEGFTTAQSFRASVALSQYDKNSENWATVAEDVANQLTSFNQIEISRWLPAIDPGVRSFLKAPLLESFRNRNPVQATEAERAAVVLSELYGDQTDWLVSTLVPESLPSQMEHLCHPLGVLGQKQNAVELIEKQLSAEMMRESPNADRQANLIVALIRLDDDYHWKHLTLGKDPTLASLIVERVGPSETPFDRVLKPLRIMSAAHMRDNADQVAGLLLSVGQFRRNQISSSQRAKLKKVLEDTFVHHPDARVHSSARWLLTRMGWSRVVRLQEDIKDGGLRRDLPEKGKNWHVDQLGNTFVVFEPGGFKMGLSNEFPTAGFDHTGLGTKDEQLHWRQIPRRFGICIHEVTVEEYMGFEKQLLQEIDSYTKYLEEKIAQLAQESGKNDSSAPAADPKPDNAASFRKLVKALGDYRRVSEKNPLAERDLAGQIPVEEYLQMPATSIEFFSMMAYCRWVSQKVGAIPNVASQAGKNFATRQLMNYRCHFGKLELNEKDLAEPSVRLPTAAEWEYACRGASQTLFPFGRDVELLDHYAWHNKNSGGKLHQVALLKPGNTGLFDILGNASEQCLDRFWGSLPIPASRQLVDFGDWYQSTPGKSRETRGGSFEEEWAYVRSSYRDSLNPINALRRYGFRLARTYPHPSDN